MALIMFQPLSGYFQSPLLFQNYKQFEFKYLLKINGVQIGQCLLYYLLNCYTNPFLVRQTAFTK